MLEIYEQEKVPKFETSAPARRLDPPRPAPSTPVPQAAGPAAHKPNRFGWLWTLLVTVGLVGAGWWLLQNGHGSHGEEQTHKPSEAREPVVVTVSSVTPRPVQRKVPVVGSLFGRDEITIAPKVSGRIVKIHHDVGDIVRPGQLLLEIDRTDYELAVEEARRGLELELSKLGLTKLPPNDFDVSKLPSVVRARAEQENAAARVQRLSGLSRQGAVGGEEKDNAEKTFAIAQASYQQALFDAQTTLATVRHRQAALDTAMQKLRDTQVVVPGSATEAEYVVSRREVSEGEMITTGPGGETPIFELVVDRPLKFKATVPERHRAEIAVGQQVDVFVEYFPRETFHGEVSRISPAVDRSSRTFQVEILVANEDRRLSAGSFARASILTHVDEAAPTVPEESLVSFAGVTKVFVVENDRVREVQVTPHGRQQFASGNYSQAWIEIEGPLPANAAVVTSGHSQLANGTPIKVRPIEVSRK